MRAGILRSDTGCHRQFHLRTCQDLSRQGETTIIADFGFDWGTTVNKWIEPVACHIPQLQTIYYIGRISLMTCPRHQNSVLMIMKMLEMMIIYDYTIILTTIATVMKLMMVRHRT